MRTIEVIYHVPAPPDVFERLTDFAQLTRWRSLESLRLEPDGPLQVGTRIYTTVKGPSQTMQFVNEVTLLDRERRAYDDRSLEGTFPIESAWRVEPDGDGARIYWTTRYEGRGAMRFLSPLLGLMIRRGQRHDLEKFAGLFAS
jgi:hypothetical protein